MTAAKQETNAPEAAKPADGATIEVATKERGRDKTYTLKYDAASNRWFDTDGNSRDPKTAKLNETKGEAFTRIAKRRMSSALTEIRSIQGLASTANYDYSEEQHTKMVAALRKEVDDLEATFKAGGKQAVDTGFTF